MIRHYSDDDERRVRMQARVREWTRAGLIDANQEAQLLARLVVDVKRTNGWLRAVLGFFTVIVVAAVVGLVLVQLHRLPRDAEVATTVWIVGALCLVAADQLAGRARLYRHGVEEMLAVASVALMAVGAYEMMQPTQRTYVPSPDLDLIAALTVAAIGGCVVFLRFGFAYAAVGAVACAGLLPFHFGWSETAGRLGGSLVFGATFFVAHTLRQRHGDEFPGDDYAIVQGALLAGAYLALNVRVLDPAGDRGLADMFPRWFYWSTYAATWLMPIAALVTAIREKDRPLQTVGAALLLITLGTNKPYLGMTRQSWDPMLLGILLMGAALGIRRWLMAGPGGQRAGYIATPILARDRELLSALANASVLWHGDATRPPAAEPNASAFQGGRSGGGGGGAGY